MMANTPSTTSNIKPNTNQVICECGKQMDYSLGAFFCKCGKCKSIFSIPGYIESFKKGES